ncbi:MAG: HAD family hydrolase [Spirochaetales bacterium]|nr:HAD family hydrolase [Candidatus Physcosoma equi]
MGYLEDNGIKAVCFDIDGTFYPLKETNMRVFRASILHLPFALRYNKARQTSRTEDSHLDKPVMSAEEISRRMAKAIYGNDDDLTIRKYERKVKKVFHEKYEKYFLSVKPYEGVVECLGELKKRGYPMGVLSDFPVGTKLSAMGIEDYFCVKVSSEDIGRYKPCRTPFRVLAERLDVKPQEILYMGDSQRKDIEGAKGAGMHTVLLTNDKSSSTADITVSSWKELYERLF